MPVVQYLPTIWKDDDRIQDLIYQNAQIGSKPVSVHLDAAKDAEGSDEIKNLREPCHSLPSISI
jgi:hypothetical protein